jgi:hypothetical protein
MSRPVLRSTIACALVVGAFLAIFFGYVNRHRNPGFNTGPGPLPRLVAKVTIPKGTTAVALVTKVRPTQGAPLVNGALVGAGEVRYEVAIRTIPAGTPLNAADFALPGPLYYPRGYPKHVPASQIPVEMSHQLPASSFPSDLEVAPGVWVDGSPSEANFDVHVAHGTLVGYCRSVRAFKAHNPSIPFTSRCWRS